MSNLKVCCIDNVAPIPSYESMNKNGRLERFLKTSLKTLGLSSNSHLVELHKLFSKHNYDNNYFRVLLRSFEVNTNKEKLATNYLQEMMEVFYCAIEFIYKASKNKMSDLINKPVETRSFDQVVADLQNKRKSDIGFVAHSKPAVVPINLPIKETKKEEMRKMGEKIVWARDRDGYPIFDRDGVQFIQIVDERSGRVYEELHPSEVREISKHDWRYEEDYDRRGQYLKNDRSYRDSGSRNDSRYSRDDGRDNRSFSSRRSERDNSNNVDNKTSMFNNNRTNVYSSAINNSKVEQSRTIDNSISVISNNGPSRNPVQKQSTDAIKSQKSGGFILRDTKKYPYPWLYRPTDCTIDVNVNDSVLEHYPREEFNKMDYLAHELNPHLRNEAITANQIRNYGELTTTVETTNISSTNLEAIKRINEEQINKERFMFNWIEVSDYSVNDFTEVSSLEAANTLMNNVVNEAKAQLPSNIDSKAAGFGNFIIRQTHRVSPDHVAFCKRIIEDLNTAVTFSGVADVLNAFLRHINGTPPQWWYAVNKHFSECANDLVRYRLAIDGTVNHYHKFGTDMLNTVEGYLGERLSNKIADMQESLIKAWNSAEGFGYIDFDETTQTLIINKMIIGLSISESMPELNINYYGKDETENFALVDEKRLPILAEKMSGLMSSFKPHVSNLVQRHNTVPVYIFTSDNKYITLHAGLLMEGSILMAFHTL